MELTDDIDIVKADFAAFTAVMDRLLTQELESFQGISSQFEARDVIDGLLGQLRRQQGRIGEGLHRLAPVVDQAPETADREIRELVAGISLYDALLDQVDRQAAVAKLRGLAETTGDLLGRVQLWLAAMKNWLKGVARQLWALLARLMTPKEWTLKGEAGTGVLGLANVGVEITFG